MLALPAVVTLWLVLFGVGRLDAKEGVRYSGDIYRWLVAPLVFLVVTATFELGAAGLTLLDLLRAGWSPSVTESVLAALAEPEVVAAMVATVSAPLVAYDLGYLSATGLRIVRARCGAVQRATSKSRAERGRIARPVASIASRLSSAYVDRNGRLVVRLR